MLLLTQSHSGSFCEAVRERRWEHHHRSRQRTGLEQLCLQGRITPSSQQQEVSPCLVPHTTTLPFGTRCCVPSAVLQTHAQRPIISTEKATLPLAQLSPRAPSPAMPAPTGASSTVPWPPAAATRRDSGSRNVGAQPHAALKAF